MAPSRADDGILPARTGPAGRRRRGHSGRGDRRRFFRTGDSRIRSSPADLEASARSGPNPPRRKLELGLGELRMGTSRCRGGARRAPNGYVGRSPVGAFGAGERGCRPSARAFRARRGACGRRRDPSRRPERRRRRATGGVGGAGAPRAATCGGLRRRRGEILGARRGRSELARHNPRVLDGGILSRRRATRGARRGDSEPTELTAGGGWGRLCGRRRSRTVRRAGKVKGPRPSAALLACSPFATAAPRQRSPRRWPGQASDEAPRGRCRS